MPSAVAITCSSTPGSTFSQPRSRACSRCPPFPFTWAMIIAPSIWKPNRFRPSKWKLRPPERGELRLVDIRDFDLTACGGTHVRSTGQIGCILLRKIEKARQGIRVEFVCGLRAVRSARRDYTTLAEAAGLYSTHIWELPQQIRKAQDEAKAARRIREQLQAELAEQLAIRILFETNVSNSRKVVARLFADRELDFIKLLAQTITRLEPNVVAFFGSTQGQAALVFAQSGGLPFDMGGMM